MFCALSILAIARATAFPNKAAIYLFTLVSHVQAKMTFYFLSRFCLVLRSVARVFGVHVLIVGKKDCYFLWKTHDIKCGRICERMHM